MSRLQVSKFEILDCSIRDGGYLNNWNFDKKMVKDICRNVSKTGVDIIEIGYRNLPKGNMGIWYSVTEELVDYLFKDISGIKAALMIDCAKSSGLSDIPDSRNSLVKMYRVACHKDKVIEAIRLSEGIKEKGYIVSIQLMGIGGYTAKDFSSTANHISKSGIDYVYFADSYGSLFPQDIKRYTEQLKAANKKIGFHAHNSLELAFANTLEAINNGVSIVDGTIFGIGRGAGNLPLEVLIIYLERTLNNRKYNSLPILDIIDRYFTDLKSKLNWGYSLPYMLSGILEVHPDYAKHLVDYHEYKVDDIVRVLEVVKDLGHIGFNKDAIDKVVNSGFVSPVGESNDCEEDDSEIEQVLIKHSVAYKDRHIDKDFLILANGPTLKEHREDIVEFIRRYNPIVMGANYLGGLFKPHYHAFSNKKRFINYVDSIDPDSRLLISSSFEDDFIKEYTDRDYECLVHLNRISGNFRIKDGIINSNCRTVSILLTAAAIVMGAKRIFIAGMDGYKTKENFLSENVHFYKESEEAENFRLLMEKHNWNDILLNKINSFLIDRGREGIYIITPTSHKHFYNSIYNWVK